MCNKNPSEIMKHSKQHSLQRSLVKCAQVWGCWDLQTERRQGVGEWGRALAAGNGTLECQSLAASPLTSVVMAPSGYPSGQTIYTRKNYEPWIPEPAIPLWHGSVAGSDQAPTQRTLPGRSLSCASWKKSMWFLKPFLKPYGVYRHGCRHGRHGHP